MQSIILEIKAKPGSKESSLNLVDDKLVARIKAQPIDGEANKELIKLLSRSLNIPQKQIEVKVGATNKNKLIKITSEFSKEKLFEKLLNSKN